MGNANLNPRTEAKVNTKNPARGPLLIIDGENDHTVPWAIANATYKRQRRNPGVTEIVKVPNRGHALTIDRGCVTSRRQRSTSSRASRRRARTKRGPRRRARSLASDPRVTAGARRAANALDQPRVR